MRQQLKKFCECTIELHTLFLDSRETFGSISRNELLMALESYIIPQKVIKLIKIILMMIRLKNSQQITSADFSILHVIALHPSCFPVNVDVNQKDVTQK